MSIYDYQATLENGETYSLANYEGQPLVIVNTATKCGLSRSGIPGGAPIKLSSML